MKDSIGYPYTYGDNGGSINCDSKACKIAIFLFLTTSSLVIFPSLCSAMNTTQLLADLALCIEGGRVCKTKEPLHPIDLVLCTAFGYCVSSAKYSASAGKHRDALILGCGAITVLCAQKGVKWYF